MNLQPEILEDDLVRIVPLSADDFTRLFAIASDPLIWEQHPEKDRYMEEVFQKYFNGAIESAGAFLVFDKATNELTGCTRYYDYNPELSSVAIGFTFLSRKYWGGDYNSAMKKLLLDHAFEFVESVLFHVGGSNIRSQKAVLKLGAKKINEFEADDQDKTLTYEYEIKEADWKG